MKYLTKAVGLALLASPLFANAAVMNLAQIYQLAAKRNATYQAAKASYDATKDQIGVSRAALLPQLAATGAITWDQQASTKTTTLGLTLTQQIVNVADWRTLSQSQANAQASAVTYAQAKQTLIYDVTNGYFTTLNNADQLKYAAANVRWQKRTLEQAEAQYKVGVKAKKDVLSAKSNYEAAVATYTADLTTYNNSLQDISQLTGTNITQLAARSVKFPLIKPSPENPNKWGDVAAKMNFNVQINKMTAKFDEAGIGVAAAGFFPTVDVAASGSKYYMDSDTHDMTVTGTVTYDFFNSGATVFSTKSAVDTYDAAKFTITQSERDSRSAAIQDYLSVLSDIEQIQSYAEAITAAQSAVNATYAGYKVGTETIVQLLQQQTTLFQNQGLYANATFSYIQDSIKLKQDTGTLTEKDVKGLNSWLTNKAVKVQTLT